MLNVRNSAFPAENNTICVFIAFSAFSIISSLFKKKPRLDIDIGKIRTELGEIPASVGQLIEAIEEPASEFGQELLRVSVNRKTGQSSTQFQKIVGEALDGIITEVQDIINQLPAELARQLNEVFLGTTFDLDTIVGRDQLLEFDDTAKSIQEQGNVIELSKKHNLCSNYQEYKLAA